MMRFWLPLLALAAAVATMAQSRIAAALRAHITLPDLGDERGALTPAIAAARLQPAPSPAIDGQYRVVEAHRGLSRKQVELVVAGLIGSFFVGVVVAAAVLLSGGVAADGSSACEDFGHAQAFLAGSAAEGDDASLAARILSDGADSPRIMQLRSMFDRCYYSAKK